MRMIYRGGRNARKKTRVIAVDYYCFVITLKVRLALFQYHKKHGY